ncbi:MAG: DUF4258 domain-containing protein [Oscillospiraceae bacterium]
MITIEILHKLCKNETINLSQHFLMRCRERRISFEDIKNVIDNGEIIETYPQDYPSPSCLVSGLSLKGEPLHVVVGVKGGILWFITTYHPDKTKWNLDFNTRRED